MIAQSQTYRVARSTRCSVRQSGANLVTPVTKSAPRGYFCSTVRPVPYSDSSGRARARTPSRSFLT